MARDIGVLLFFTAGAVSRMVDGENSMRHQIECAPGFAKLRLELSPGEKVMAEAGAMLAKTPAIRFRTMMNADTTEGFVGKAGAFFTALFRKVVGGETFFVNEFRAEGNEGTLWLAPTMPGDLNHQRISSGERLIISSSCYMASAGNIRVNPIWGGFKALFAREGLFYLEITGEGDLWFNSAGGIQEIPVNGSLVIDTGHIAGYTGSLDYEVRRVNTSWKSFFLSGEGLVAEFKGNGRVWLQTRSRHALVKGLTRYLPE